MITTDDFHKKVQLFVVDEEKRDWRRLWLRKRARRHLVFAGYMKHISQEVGMNEPYRLTVQFADAMEYMRYRAVHYTKGDDTLVVSWNPYRDWWEGVRP